MIDIAEQRMIIKNQAETEAFGKHLADSLLPGDIIALVGDLGTGKTTLTKSIAAGLGITDTVTSPTFTIVHEYREGRLPLFHFDVYRLSSADDLDELGYEEYFFGNGVCVVEWADIVMEAIPEGSLVINIQYGEKDNERIYDLCIL